MQEFTYTRVVTVDELTAIQAYTDNLSQNNPVMAGYDPTQYAQETLDGAIQNIIDQGNNLGVDAIKRDLVTQIQSLTTVDDLTTVKDTLSQAISSLPVRIRPTPIEKLPPNQLPAEQIVVT
jgi:hypothetical protein